MRIGDTTTLVGTVNTKENDCTIKYRLKKNWGVLVLVLGPARTGSAAAALPVQSVHARLDEAVAAYKAAHPLPAGSPPNA